MPSYFFDLMLFVFFMSLSGRVYQLIQTGLGYTLMCKVAKVRDLSGGLRALKIVFYTYLLPSILILIWVIYVLFDYFVFSFGNGITIWDAFLVIFGIWINYNIHFELKRRVVEDETFSWGKEKRPEYILEQKRIDEAIKRMIK